MDISKIGFGDVASGVSGVTSLIKGLTAKKPGKYKPKSFNSYVSPAQADLEALQRTKNDIAGGAAGAISEVKKIAGSDGNASIRGILGVNANANKAVQTAEATSSDQYTKDKIRVGQEKNQAELINTQIMNEASQLNNYQDQNNYNAKVSVANQGVQSALNYFTGKEADNKNKAVIGKQSNQAVDLMREASKNSIRESMRDKFSDPLKLEEHVNKLTESFDGYKTEIPQPQTIGSLLGGLFKKRKVSPVASQIGQMDAFDPRLTSTLPGVTS